MLRLQGGARASIRRVAMLARIGHRPELPVADAKNVQHQVVAANENIRAQDIDRGDGERAGDAVRANAAGPRCRSRPRCGPVPGALPSGGRARRPARPRGKSCARTCERVRDAPRFPPRRRPGNNCPACNRSALRFRPQNRARVVRRPRCGDASRSILLCGNESPPGPADNARWRGRDARRAIPSNPTTSSVVPWPSARVSNIRASRFAFDFTIFANSITVAGSSTLRCCAMFESVT